MLRLGRNSEPAIQKATAAAIGLGCLRSRRDVHLQFVMRQQVGFIVADCRSVLTEIAGIEDATGKQFEFLSL